MNQLGNTAYNRSSWSNKQHHGYYVDKLMLDYQYVYGTRLLSVIEALIFASPSPITWEKISEIIKKNKEEIELDRDTIETAVIQLNTRYEENDLSFRIEHTGGGFTFVKIGRASCRESV